MGNSGATDGAGPGLRKRDVPVYLDYQATTPTDPRVVQAMLPYFSEKFGNPHSREHFFGWEAEDAVEKARGEIARLIGATAREVIFTSLSLIHISEPTRPY